MPYNEIPSLAEKILVNWRAAPRLTFIRNLAFKKRHQPPSNSKRSDLSRIFCCHSVSSFVNPQPKEITMNSKTLITTLTTLTAAIALLSAASSFATVVVSEADLSLPMVHTSNVTRAEVRAAALQARSQGTQIGGDFLELTPTKSASTVTRAQVRAETLEAIRLHAIGHGEQNYFPTQAQLDSIRVAGDRAVSLKMASL
jgi:hypothetical protein